MKRRLVSVFCLFSFFFLSLVKQIRSTGFWQCSLIYFLAKLLNVLCIHTCGVHCFICNGNATFLMAKLLCKYQAVDLAAVATFLLESLPSIKSSNRQSREGMPFLHDVTPPQPPNMLYSRFHFPKRFRSIYDCILSCLIGVTYQILYHNQHINKRILTFRFHCGWGWYDWGRWCNGNMFE